MRTIAIIALCTISGAAHAGFWDGNQPKRGCDNDRSFIVGYVTGWVDKHETDTMLAKDHMLLALKSGSQEIFQSARETANLIQMKVCLPDQVTAGQVADVFCKSLRDNPATRHRAGTLLLETALNQAFPCS